MPKRKMSDAGEILWATLQRHREHLEEHDCHQCYDGYATFLEAMTQWVGSFDDAASEAVDIFGVKKKRKDNGDGG